MRLYLYCNDDLRSYDSALGLMKEYKGDAAYVRTIEIENPSIEMDNSFEYSNGLNISVIYLSGTSGEKYFLESVYYDKGSTASFVDKIKECNMQLNEFINSDDEYFTYEFRVNLGLLVPEFLFGIVIGKAECQCAVHLYSDIIAEIGDEEYHRPSFPNPLYNPYIDTTIKIGNTNSSVAHFRCINRDEGSEEIYADYRVIDRTEVSLYSHDLEKAVVISDNTYTVDIKAGGCSNQSFKIPIKDDDESAYIIRSINQGIHDVSIGKRKSTEVIFRKSLMPHSDVGDIAKITFKLTIERGEG